MSTDDDIAAVTALLDQAKHLGLLPTYRYGTVVSSSSSNPSNTLVTLDGDDQAIRAFNVAGYVYAGARVFTVAVEPHGVYILGRVTTSTVPTKVLDNSSGSSTFRPTTGLMYAFVEVVGGGGGGGGVGATVAAQSAAGGGGSGGSYAAALFTAAQLGSSVSYTVGASGAGGVAGANNGTAGGNTTFLTLTGSGGGAGNGMASAVGPTIANGGTPVAATGGTLNVTGSFGNNGLVVAGAVVQQGFGGGGAVFGGLARGTASVVGGNGVTGLIYGGGGSGAHNFPSQAARSGGAGSTGAVIITQYFA